MYSDISTTIKSDLDKFLQHHINDTIIYNTLNYVDYFDSVFKYPNYSLISFNGDNEINGFIPQWKRNSFLESIPWRDKGGPIVSSDSALKQLSQRTIYIANNVKSIKCVVWKDFNNPYFKTTEYFINVDIDLSSISHKTYRSKISSKVRGKLNKSEKNGLIFDSRTADDNIVNEFYNLFLLNRHRLGVPAYHSSLFFNLEKFIPKKSYKYFFARDKDGNALAAILIFIHNNTAIDAYSASSRNGLVYKANDFLMYNTILYCLNNEINLFDFGADSPIQESLIQYKLKWLGIRRNIVSSYYGNYIENDHNSSLYSIAKWIIKRLPLFIYKRFSHLLIS